MRPILASMLTVLLATSARAQPGTQDDATIRWLARHAVRLAPAPPEGDGFADLRPLAPLLRDRRVVILGEATHGQGDVLALKARLVEYLHEELEFDVLAWEAGMYDMDLAWRRVLGGDPPVQALRDGLPQFWGESAQVEPLLRYVAERARSSRPLQVVGLDTHVGVTEESQRHLLSDLRELTSRLGAAALPESDLASLELLWDDTRPDGSTKGLRDDPQVVTAAARVLASLRATLHRPDATALLGDSRRRWWLQCLATLAHKARAVDASRADAWLPGLQLAPAFNPRDEQSAANLLWLARERYPDRKIVVWSATMHGARRVEAINGPIDYRGVLPMGHLAWLGLGDEMYVLGSTTFAGEEGLPWQPPTAIPAADPGSFEDWARAAGLEVAWVDLSMQPPGSPLRGPFRARPLGNLEMDAVWSRTLDGLLFVQRVGPNTRRPD